MMDLKEKTLRGGVAKLCGQVADFGLRLLTTALLGRLLDPKDFGLVAMVTVVTGVYNMFTTAGLSSATIQHASVNEKQLSTLFWVNIAVGVGLAILSLGTAPVLASFYHEPRLFWVTVAIATGFVANAAGVQHWALLHRQMRFGAITVIELTTQASVLIIGVSMALAGMKYWALVTMVVSTPFIGTLCRWIATRWVPSLPARGTGVRPMLRFGGTLTLNSFVIYLGYNLEKVMLGRFWGAQALGLYGKAYNLVNIPVENVNSSVGSVAFSALSRVQDDPPRLKAYFLKGYSLVMSLTFPMTIFCAIFAEEIILILLGPKWQESAVIFRLLTPTVLVFGMIDPMGWLLLSLGLQVRSLKISMVIAPLVITAEVIGLSYGPTGVAFANSAAMTLWLVPHLYWCTHGTIIKPGDLMRSIAQPLLSAVAAAALTFAIKYQWGDLIHPLPRLAIGGVLMVGIYLYVLLYVAGQKEMYLDLIRGMRNPAGKAVTGGTPE